jgi:hypothetical protein
MDVGVHGEDGAGQDAGQRGHVSPVEPEPVRQRQPPLHAAGLRAVAVVVFQAAAPFAPQVGGGQAREQGRVLPRDARLVVVAVERPGLHLPLGQAAVVQQPVEGVEDVVALLPHGAQARFQLVGREQRRHAGTFHVTPPARPGPRPVLGTTLPGLL